MTPASNTSRAPGAGAVNRVFVWVLTGPLGRLAAFVGDLGAAWGQWAARRLRERRH